MFIFYIKNVKKMSGICLNRILIAFSDNLKQTRPNVNIIVTRKTDDFNETCERDMGEYP